MNNHNTFLVFNLLICSFAAWNVFCQETPNTLLFTSPVSHELRLAGTFGELRSNHYHMGLDIKSSQGRSGDPVYASADGFVSRILVSRTGYGNALYIEHPNGYTTVYGHLNGFSEMISKTVEEKQYAEQSFELNFYPDSTTILVKQGDLIGYMGNTGSSGGPHLHFEIRETESEAPINPMLFGIKPVDHTPPIIGDVVVYYLDDNHRTINTTVFNTEISSGNTYKIKNGKLAIGAWRIGLGLKTIDPMNNSRNKNGIYKLILEVDGVPVFETRYDSISFEDTRYINASIDYEYFQKYRSRFQRLYKLPGNSLPLIESNENSIITLYKDKPRNVLIKVYDFHGNSSQLTFDIKRKDFENEAPPLIYNYHLQFDEPNIIEQQNFKIFFRKGTFYEDTYLYVTESVEKEAARDIRTLHLGNENIPLHYDATLFIQPSYKFEDSLKMIVTDISGSGKPISYGGAWENEYLKTSIDVLGNFTIGVDTTSPSITLLSGPSTNQKSTKYRFKIDDNYIPSGTAKGLQYNAYIDDQWVIFEYDLKSKTLTHHLRNLGPGEHTLLLEVWDDRNNKSVFQEKFLTP